MIAAAPTLRRTDFVPDICGIDRSTAVPCGTCTGVWPWPTVKRSCRRRAIRFTSLGLEGYRKQILRSRVLDNTYVIRPSRSNRIIDPATRMVVIEPGSYSQTHKARLGNRPIEDNPRSALPTVKQPRSRTLRSNHSTAIPSTERVIAFTQ